MHEMCYSCLLHYSSLYTMKRSFGKYLLLLVLYTSTAGGDVELECNQNGLMLKDALRESSCRIKGSVNDTERFGVGVRTKHGVGLGPYYTFAYLFRPTTSKVWCRTSCEDIAPENITWCVNIASFENDVETCISLNNATHKVITNSSCEAEVIQLPDYLSLPTDCALYGNVGCLGLTSLDWLFESAYLTCTVQTHSCYEKSFTQLLTINVVVQPPVFDIFPSSPHIVHQSDSMVLHVVITSTTDRISLLWQHNGTEYSQFIFEDPFCDTSVEECQKDNHFTTTFLRQQRVRVYKMTRRVNLEACQRSLLFEIECFLIVDSVQKEDSGEYTINVTSTHYPSSFSITRSVNVSIVDEIPLDDHHSEVDGAGVIEYSTTCITIITTALALLIGVWG